MALKIGDIVGDYKVIDHAGSGGMGIVYKIEHVLTKRVEAMKMLLTGIGTGPDDVRRFEREIEVQARLHHPNIVTLYNAVRDDHSIALLMEYVEGQSLESMLKRGRLPIHTAANYTGQVLDALAYAHDKGVIHRDVTPANIIITPSGTAKLTDFGLALAANHLRLTSAGVAVGSAWYMSPEQVRAADQLDVRTDIYATGAVLHELLTGRKLFDAEGSFAVMRGQLEAIPQPPSALNLEVPAALDAVVARALAKDPAARFQTAREFRVVLAAALEGMCSSGAVLELQPAQKTMRRQSTRAAAPEPTSRRDEFLPPRAAIAVGLASAVLVAVVGAVVWWPKATRVSTGARVPPDAVSTLVRGKTSLLVTDPAPPNPSVQTPGAPIEADTRASRQTAKQTPTVGDLSRAAPLTSPRSTLKSWPRVPERATEANLAAVPAAAAATASTAEPEAVPQKPKEAAPQKTGNRFLRVLSKLNPFHRGSKSDPLEPATGAPTESPAK